MKKLMIALSIALAACQTAKPEEAQKAADEFVKQVPGGTSASCASADTDDDGYCACTIFRTNADPFRVDCGCERFCIWNCARGCKVVEGVKFQGR